MQTFSELFNGKNHASNGKHAETEAHHATGKSVAKFGEVTAEWRLITPDIATSIIETQNTQNRGFRKNRVAQLCRAMERGAFRLTHQAIAFDQRGVLIDGQHRLRAIIASGASITLLVVEGLDPIARASTDIGVARTPADMLKIVGGEERAKLVAKTLQAIRRSVFNTSEKLDWDEMDQLRKFFGPGLEWACGTMSSHRKHTSGPVAGALVFAYKKHPEIVANIYQEIETGECPPGDSIIQFRDLLLSSSLTGERFSGEIFGKLLTVIWHRAHGRKVNKLYATGEAMEYFEKSYK